MRVVDVLAAIVVFVIALSPLGSAQATQIDDATSQERDPLIVAVLADLKVRTEVALKDPAKSWLSELAGYYAAPGAQSLWASPEGVTPRAEQAMDEIRRAGDYGLDPDEIELSDLPATPAAPADLASFEVRMSLAAVKYAWYARGGRVDPSQLSLWLDQTPRVVYASQVLAAIAAESDAGKVLSGFQPHHPGFENLRLAYLKERDGKVSTPGMLMVPGPLVSRGERHADVALARARLGVGADSDEETLLDREVADAIRAFMSNRGLGRKRVLDDEVRVALNRSTALPSPGPKRSRLDKYIVNLERWRWMPVNLGEFHVWNNLPEFETRVMSKGALVHRERIVIGTPGTQTPIFSDAMSHVIFQPEWGVPESIKIRQLLPRLRGGDSGVLKRRNMRIVADGREISPSRFNWSKVSIRDVPIVQGAGPDNPLGRLKFIFPNGHDVYMHDTPSKSLFETRVRTHSHGCIRVRNPERFAEVILGGVNGWTKSDVTAHLANPKTQQIDLTQSVPVHNTYFTLTADDAGTVQSFDDVYGHDKRILDALNGKPIKVIAAADPALALQKENRELAKRSYFAQKPKPAVPLFATGFKPGPFLFAPPPQPWPRHPSRPVKFGMR